MLRARTWISIALAGVALCVPRLRGESIMSDVIEVPVDRVAKNIETLLEAHPDDVQLRVNLARTHMMAFALKSSSIKVARGRETAGPDVPWLQDNILPTVTPTTDSAKLEAANAHLQKAITLYRQAIALAPGHALARLGYAWALQSSGATANAVEAYREAVRVAWPADHARTIVLMGSQSITEEAARYLIRLLDPVTDKDEIATLRTYMTQLEGMKRAITPIVIPLRDGLNALDLVDASARVSFDLDGSGLKKPWTWISSDTAWLVMDLHQRGEIRSGLQLFGNVTFWLFWNNGYEALRSLDDDGDGRLSGRELDGLALWRDANGNGLSERGEVKPVADWHIVELSSAYRHDERHPDEIAYSPAGVRFADGRTRPTYDVVLHQRR